MKKQFKDWIADGNVVKIDNFYSTQCSNYRNRFKTLDELFKFFKKEFFKK